MQQCRAWNKSVNLYSEAGSIIVVPNCFAFMFTNVGDDTAFVDGMVIFPNATPATGLGDSRTLSGHILDIYKGTINLKFAGVGVAPLVEIVQLFYHPGTFELQPL